VRTSAEIAAERQGAAVVAHLSGEVDMSNSSYVGTELAGCVPNDALALVIDLARTRYLDSAAIEMLFDLARRLSRRRQQLRLMLPAGSPLTRLLELTDIASVAPVFDSLEAALAE
jgi:anti-sigma B factor antagonist